ncbi:hypothetical protein [Pseudovibrio exalbescens]|uniref:Phage tail tube protein, GTA-gp10 n=1 Tax=Pseudovibrio exalbescens TaxID=197461 RepID=A0A1U7JJY7_9HYPH|nr:hypothetical protein [Pseudovibrio exalbescens]OKL45008.1 hypothetical protein A3843_05330 [Pseudovibrio exalbescens]
MRKPIKSRGEVACSFNGKEYILCATMAALDQIEVETDLAIADLINEINKKRLSVLRRCFEALVVEGDAAAAFADKVGVAELPELSISIMDALIPDMGTDEGKGDAASAS